MWTNVLKTAFVPVTRPASTYTAASLVSITTSCVTIKQFYLPHHYWSLEAHVLLWNAAEIIVIEYLYNATFFRGAHWQRGRFSTPAHYPCCIRTLSIDNIIGYSSLGD